MPKHKKLPSHPENWPHTIPYLSQPIISPSLPRDILSTTALSPPSLEADALIISTPATPYANIRITPISDPSHPACGQAGLFTTRQHTPGEFICLYLGFVHGTTKPDGTLISSTEGHDKSDYDLSLDRDLGLAIDAAKMGNESRFINDYRGIADRPNAEFRDVIVKRTGGAKERGVGVIVKAAKKDKKGKVGKGKGDGAGIGKGEEVLVSYGRGFWSVRRVEADVEGEEEDG